MYGAVYVCAPAFGGDEPPSRTEPHAATHIGEHDDHLVAALRRGDRTAFEQLVRQYYDALYRFAWSWLRAGEPAEDIVQDVLWRLWEQHERLAVHTSVRAYLYRAVRNAIADHRRHEGIVQAYATAYTTQGDMDASSASVASPDAQYESRELRAALDAAIAALPERTRAVYTLHHHAGLRHAEIADSMGMTVKGVEFHMGKALKLLRQALARFAPE